MGYRGERGWCDVWGFWVFSDTLELSVKYSNSYSNHAQMRPPQTGVLSFSVLKVMAQGLIDYVTKYKIGN